MLLWRVSLPIAMAVVGFCVLWLVGLIWFANPPPAESRAAPTDAIVVLTGGSFRIQSGIELLREGKGRKLFVSGVNQQVAVDDLLRVSRFAPDWASCCVVLGHEADNTRGNADETARWMRSQGFRSLRLVTSWYHMPRSLLEFQRAMPDVEILAHPVFPERAKQEHWWAWRDTAVLLMIEYVKYLRALLRPALDWMQPATQGRLGAAKAEMRP
jgi:uncharacterized SAM-binding protein YcdF (DUF218 family)